MFHKIRFAFWIPDVVLWAVLGFNLWQSFRLRRARRRFAQDSAGALVSALETLAANVCPMCAIAAGSIGDGTLVEATSGHTGAKLEVEPEADGKHIVHDNGCDVTVQCRATQIRKDAKKVLDGAMPDTLREISHDKVSGASRKS